MFPIEKTIMHKNPSSVRFESCLPVGIWSIEQSRMNKELFKINILKSESELMAFSNIEKIRLFDVTNSGVAIINVRGLITKGFNFFGTSAALVKQAVKMAVADSGIKGIFFVIDSGGGHTSGIFQLAEAIKTASKEMPVSAHIEDLGASAAFWIASQASFISASPMTEIGSIGVFTVIDDTSKMFEEAGIKVTVISTGKFKGSFVRGAEVTDEMIAEMQKRVNDVNDFFLKAVERGRGLSAAKVEKLADGSVMMAKDAKESGLIDEVMSVEKAFELFEKTVKKESKSKSKSFEATKTRIRLSELK